MRWTHPTNVSSCGRAPLATWQGKDKKKELLLLGLTAMAASTNVLHGRERKCYAMTRWNQVLQLLSHFPALSGWENLQLHRSYQQGKHVCYNCSKESPLKRPSHHGMHKLPVHGWMWLGHLYVCTGKACSTCSIFLGLQIRGQVGGCKQICCTHNQKRTNNHGRPLIDFKKSWKPLPTSLTVMLAACINAAAVSLPRGLLVDSFEMKTWNNSTRMVCLGRRGQQHQRSHSSQVWTHIATSTILCNQCLAAALPQQWWF